MAKGHNNSGRSKNDARHVRIYQHMANTYAWRSLPSTAAKAYVTICLVYNGSNNGALGIGARWLGKELGLCQSAAAKAINDLIGHGFLQITKSSSFSRKRTAAEYRLTAFPCNKTGESATKNYLRFGVDRSTDKK